MPKPRAPWTGILFALALLSTTPTAHAGGVPAFFDRTGWHLSPERAQHAVVVLADGKEHLLLQVALGHDVEAAQASKLSWVTPIPARASETQVRILRGFPTFSGTTPRGEAQAAARGLLALMAATQVWSVPFAFVGLLASYGGGAKGLSSAKMHTSLLRDGIQLDLLNAPSVAALAEHLEERGLGLPEAGRPGLEPYANEEHCFVVFRIADLSAYRAAQGGTGRGHGLVLRPSFLPRRGFPAGRELGATGFEDRGGSDNARVSSPDRSCAAGHLDGALHRPDGGITGGRRVD